MPLHPTGTRPDGQRALPSPTPPRSTITTAPTLGLPSPRRFTVRAAAPSFAVLSTSKAQRFRPHNACPPPSSGLYLKHHVVCDRFQVGYELYLAPDSCVLQGTHQPSQSCCVGIPDQC